MSQCRRRGGIEEERAERQRWNQREQQKIMDSVRGKWKDSSGIFAFAYCSISLYTGLANIRRRAIALREQRLRMNERHGGGGVLRQMELGDEEEGLSNSEEGEEPSNSEPSNSEEEV